MSCHDLAYRIDKNLHQLMFQVSVVCCSASKTSGKQNIQSKLKLPIDIVGRRNFHKHFDMVYRYITEGFDIRTTATQKLPYKFFFFVCVGPVDMLLALLNFKLLSLILSDRYLKVLQWPNTRAP